MSLHREHDDIVHYGGDKDLSWTSCCRGRKCARFALDGDDVIIKDDVGGAVRLSAEELKGFIESVQELQRIAYFLNKDRDSVT